MIIWCMITTVIMTFSKPYGWVACLYNFRMFLSFNINSITRVWMHFFVILMMILNICRFMGWFFRSSHRLNVLKLSSLTNEWHNHLLISESIMRFLAFCLHFVGYYIQAVAASWWIFSSTQVRNAVLIDFLLDFCCWMGKWTAFPFSSIIV